MVNLILGYLFIFCARVIDVGLGTVRTLMLVKGKRMQAAAIGFFEVIIFILALNIVFKNLDNPVNLFFYALGFAAGNYVGSIVDDYMAIGNISAQIIPKVYPLDMIEALRDAGFGVTVLTGMGRQIERKILIVYLKRKDLSRLMKIVDEIEKESFITIMDTRSTVGGYFQLAHKSK